MRSFLLVALAVTCVVAGPSNPNKIPNGKVEDVMNVVIINAETPEEKEMMATNVKEMTDNITEVAKSAVFVLKKNKVLLDKAANLIKNSKDGLATGEENFGAMDLMQTVLLVTIMEEEQNTTDKTPVEDILDILIIDAETQEEKKIMAANVKKITEDITDVAKSAVVVLKKNKELLDKASSLIKIAKDMIGEEDDDLGAVDLMQTILLVKIQEVIMEQDEDTDKDTSDKTPIPPEKTKPKGISEEKKPKWQKE